MQASLSTSAADTSSPPPTGTLHFLVVDGRDHVRSACANIAADLGFIARDADSSASAHNAIQQKRPDLLLIDLEIPGGGLGLLDQVHCLHPSTRVVVMTEFASVENAVEAMRLGASDYLPRPFTVDQLAAVLARASDRRHLDLESRILRDRIQTPAGLGELIGRSPEMEKLYRILSKVAFTSHPVLILGESGTGKELVARSIHFNGPGADRPFHLVDCSAGSPDALEAELFGRVSPNTPGHITPGLLSSDDGGTILLDAIADLSPDLQSCLLRALQDKEVRTAGSIETRPLTARVLASTSRNLPALVDSGRFRKDLFYRLNVVNLRLPPLRDRKSDIPILARHFLRRLERETGATLTLSDETLGLLEDYDWPGNVRELEAAMERACALNSGPVLHLGDLPTQLQDFRHQREAELAAPEPGPPAPLPADFELPTGGAIVPIAAIERHVILKALHQLNGDKLTTARLLGIGKTTLYRKLREYGIGELDAPVPPLLPSRRPAL